jgi:[ribosomal protein S5]-alanine N-acetyltransferase
LIPCSYVEESAPQTRPAVASTTAVTAEPLRLGAAHVDLISCSADAARASLQSPASLELLLGSTVPPTWPPSELVDVLAVHASSLDRDPAQLGWGLWLVLSQANHTLVGSAGFKGKPDARGCVEIGYGIEPAYRGRGFATEAVGALIGWAWEQGARRIVAETHPDNAASIALLRRAGMTPIRPRSGMLWWELRVPC